MIEHCRINKMALILLSEICFYLLYVLSFVPVESLSSVFKASKHLNYNNRYCSDQSYVIGKAVSKSACSILCSEQGGYKGFFFNDLSHSCSCVNIVHFPENGCSAQNGSDYYVFPEAAMAICYSYTGSDLARMTTESNRYICNSYPYHVYQQDIDLSLYGCGQCQCCTTVGCYSGDHRYYKGTWARTSTGKECQRWDQHTPHYHIDVNKTFYGETDTEAENHCRDPDNEGGLWCYTVDPSSRWEFCGIPSCA